jgi:TPR repeat protein
MMLGRYLYRGLAGERDVEQARFWLEKALAQGLHDVKAELASLPPAPAPKPVEPAYGAARIRANQPQIMHGPGPDAPAAHRPAALADAETADRQAARP